MPRSVCIQYDETGLEICLNSVHPSRLTGIVRRKHLAMYNAESLANESSMANQGIVDHNEKKKKRSRLTSVYLPVIGHSGCRRAVYFTLVVASHSDCSAARHSIHYKIMARSYVSHAERNRKTWGSGAPDRGEKERKTN